MKKKIKIFLARIVLWCIGWKIKVNVKTIPDKCVVIGAPHASWIDVVIGVAAGIVLDIPLHYLAKKELFDFPWSIVFKNVSGGIPVDRYSSVASEDRKKIIQNLAQRFKEQDSMRLVISPEGTRKKVRKWKTGFYRIAWAAKVPIVLGYLDHKNKIGCIDTLIYPSGDLEKDMREILKYYQSLGLDYKDRFALDERYI